MSKFGNDLESRLLYNNVLISKRHNKCIKTKFKIHLLEQESIKHLYENRIKGNFPQQQEM